MYEHITLTREDDLAILTLQRPERANTLHEPMWHELRRAALQLSDRPPRVVILAGAGEHFCGGMDLADDNPLMQRLQPAMLNRDGMRVAEIITELKNIFDSFARLPCPILCAIEGACMGSGLELALMADLRIGSQSARLSLPETRVGMLPDVGGTVRLVRLIGRARATDMVLTGRQLDADEAWEMGLLNRVCAKGKALTVAREVAAEILLASPFATSQALLILRRTQGWSDDEAYRQETNAGARTIVRGECIEGLAAFAEKRRALW